MSPLELLTWAGVVLLVAVVALFVFLIGWFIHDAVRGKL